MTIKQRLLAFACGAAVIATTNALVVDINLWAAADDGPLEVCVNDEGVMRLVTGDAACAAGERRVALKTPEVEKSCEKEQQAEVAGMRNRLAALEANTVEGDRETATAPFEVVNERNTIVFSVEESNGGDLPALTKFFTETGARIATIAAREAGGELTVSSFGPPAGTSAATGLSGVEATLSAWGDYADFRVTANSDLRFELGRRREGGKYGLAIFNAGGKRAAAFGASQGDSGIALIYDELGRQRLSLNCRTSQGAGMVEVINSAMLPVVTLAGDGEAESGVLQLTNNVGEPMVKARVFPIGRGAVQAGPGAFQHGVMFAGLPASYIEGKNP